MALEFISVVRRPVISQAIRVTEENMSEVSEKCGGEIKKQGKKSFIQVPVKNPQSERQAKAFVGDWVLCSEPGWKVYTNKAYESIFDVLLDYPCGDTNTLDGNPCVLGRGHKTTEKVVSCRSMTDFKLMTSVGKKRN